MTHLMMGFALEGPKVGPDVGKASPVGLFIVVLLLIGVFVLVWSMNRHLKRIPESFDTEAPEQSSPDGAPPAETTSRPERPAHEPGS
jgi:hypothetical protein